LLALLLSAGCAPPTTPAPPADRLTPLLARADELAAEGSRSAAETTYREALALSPFDPAPHLRLAHLYLEWNRPEEGLAEVLAAEQTQAPATEVASLRAALHALQGNWAACVSHAREAVALNPDDLASRHYVAHGYVVLGDAPQAAAEYEALLEIAPGDALARERLGALLAILEPGSAPPHLKATGTPLAADLLEALEEATDDDPAQRLALVGQACTRHEEWELAVLALETAVAANPSHADALTLLGHALDQMGRTEEALPRLETAAELAPDSSLTRSLLGLAYLRRGEFASARPHLDSAYDRDPENPALCLYMAHLYAGLGRYDVADVWLEEATRLAPEDPAVWEAAARFYLERGLAESQRGLEAALSLSLLSPESASAHWLLGWAQHVSGHLAEAELHLGRAIELDPSLAPAHYQLGLVYVDLGQVGDARRAFGAALDTNTDPVLRARIEESLLSLQ
jgi:tetratricopeptide (TPR) repeat protein